MIKSLFFQTLKICLVLAIGQVPMGKSTVGGEFISTLSRRIEKSAGKKSVEKVGSFFESLRLEASPEPIREVSGRKKISIEQLKNLIPKDRFEDNDSEELNRVLEKE